MIPLIAALAAARRASGLRQQDIAHGLGMGASAGISMISGWERGKAVPTVGHACGWAVLMSRRVVVVRDGAIVGDLLDVLPRLRELLDDAGLTVHQVAAGLFAEPTSIYSIIRLAGPRTRLPGVMSVLGAGRYTLDLAPATDACSPTSRGDQHG